ncbi:MAG: helix-turn-helix domain-containing protein [Gemmatimonadaceae bacterium]
MRPRHLTAMITNLALLLLGVAPALFVASWLWLNRGDDLVALLPTLPTALAYNLVVFAIPLGVGCFAHYLLMYAARRFSGLSGSLAKSSMLDLSCITRLQEGTGHGDAAAPASRAWGGGRGHSAAGSLAHRAGRCGPAGASDRGHARGPGIVGYGGGAARRPQRLFSGCRWVRRFNNGGSGGGIAALGDAPRSGRPPRHPPAVKSRLLDLALRKPRTLGEPFALWTLERLQCAFEEQAGVHLSDSTIWTWLKDEGLVWKRQQSWFHAPHRHDPEFVEKRGPSSRRTSPRPSARG